MKINNLSIALIILSLAMPSFGQSPPTAREVMARSREQAKLSGLESKTTLEIYDGKGNKRVRETTMASRVFPDGTEKRVIVFLTPADVKGTGILIFDYTDKPDDMWIYMPALRKSRKIVSTEKGKSFMGSEFSNSDLSVGALDDFAYQLDGSEVMDGTDCWKIRMTPANAAIAAEEGGSGRITWIAKKDYMPRRTEFLDKEGKVWKELIYGGIKLLDQKGGKYFVTHMEARNLKTGRYSIMNMDQVAFNPSVREDYLTLSFLENQ
ncbi:MAG: outer membrane lipoprotein-sorting protein [Bacteroidales bacterium]